MGTNFSARTATKDAIATAESVRTRPIIFSSEMVRAILDGKKSQTRRIIKPQPEKRSGAMFWESPRYDNGDGVHYLHTNEEAAIRLMESACFYGISGDRLWCKETFAMRADIDWRKQPKKALHYCKYKATQPEFEPDNPMNFHRWDGWKSSRFMPRCLSRITLEITKVRVERLQDITPEECDAEGIRLPDTEMFPLCNSGSKVVAAYRRLWDSLHGKGAWEKNSWVWVIEFRKL